ncbi:MAG: Histidine kinase [Chloroflexota bacterium]|nr:Histidine kinase [Chloroflexota bacterium]
MRARRGVALACLALAIGGGVGAVVIRVVSGAPFLPAAFGFGPAAMVGFIVLGMSWASVGAFLVMRRPENAVGLLMVVAGAGYASTMFFAALVFAFAFDGTARSDRLAEMAAWATLLANQVGAFGFLILFIFPTGRAQSQRWAWFTRFAALMMLAASAVVLIQPGPLHLTPTLDNPFAIGPDLRGDQPFSPLFTLFSVIAAPAIPVALAMRYRMAGHTERQQLKWFALAGVVAIAGVAFAGWGAMLNGGSPGEVGLVVYSFGAAFVAVAIAIAILRHNLYDIDRIVSRTIAYALVSAIVAVVFGGVVVLLSTALASFAQGQTVAVAASTLAAFAVFQPVLRRVRHDVDRRFHRARYDSDQTVASFSARLRDQIDLAHLRVDLDSTIRAAMAPRSVEIWLRDSHR